METGTLPLPITQVEEPKHTFHSSLLLFLFLVLLSPCEFIKKLHDYQAVVAHDTREAEAGGSL